MRSRLLHVACLISVAAGCVVGDDEDLDGDPDGAGDTGEDGGNIEVIEAGMIDPANVNVGFNNGYAEQFGYFPTFFNATNAVKPAARLCHAYVQWNVANQAPGTGSVADHSTRAFIADWLSKAQGQCDEALISFKSMKPGSPPPTTTFAAAFEKFAATNWAAETGFTGTLAYTPWNEPNNGDNAGNGLGVEIPARVAARYFLAAARSCKKHGCKVAAGDFASNGNMWDDYRWNCANDNVAPKDLCRTKSGLNPDGRGASYLDIYKNEIVNRAVEFGFAKGYRPEYFAYHGWHDTNRYLNEGDHCSTYETCTVRRLLRSLSGSWGGVVIWNTEDGVGQFSTNAPDDRAQACGAAFQIRLHTISRRIKRLYLTRLKGGPGTLISAAGPRPAMKLLTARMTEYSGGNCR